MILYTMRILLLSLTLLSALLGAESSSGGKDNATTGLVWKPVVGQGTRSGTCFNLLVSGGSVLEDASGCPAKIPITLDGKILAARFYTDIGNELPQLACNGICVNMYAETKYSDVDPYYQAYGSIIINPGCTMYAFTDYDQKGTSKGYTGLLPNPPTSSSGPIYKCDDGLPCIKSVLWTCKQTYPSCTPTDDWQVVTELDNSASSIPTTFSYQKTVGTTFSQEMQDSMSISVEVSAGMKSELFGISAGIKSTTGYNWAQTDTETQSNAKAYTVQVEVPKGVKVRIEEAVGTCAGSKIYTQLFRVVEPTTGAELSRYNGKMQNYVISGGQLEECLKVDNTNYYGFDIANKKVSGLDECTSWCREIPTCKYWSLRKSSNGCFLKTSDSGKRADRRTMSGSRNC